MSSSTAHVLCHTAPCLETKYFPTTEIRTFLTCPVRVVSPASPCAVTLGSSQRVASAPAAGPGSCHSPLLSPAASSSAAAWQSAHACWCTQHTQVRTCTYIRTEYRITSTYLYTAQLPRQQLAPTTSTASQLECLGYPQGLLQCASVRKPSHPEGASLTVPSLTVPSTTLSYE